MSKGMRNYNYSVGSCVGLAKIPFVLGFVVCLLLYAALLLQDVCACTVHIAHVYMCVGRGTDPQIGLGQ